MNGAPGASSPKLLSMMRSRTDSRIARSGRPDTTAPTEQTAAASQPDIGAVDATTAAELGVEQAIEWGRRYLDALAAGDYDFAAALVPDGLVISLTESPTDPVWTLTDGQFDPGAEPIVDGPLSEQLRAYCEGGDALCLPEPRRSAALPASVTLLPVTSTFASLPSTLPSARALAASSSKGL